MLAHLKHPTRLKWRSDRRRAFSVSTVPSLDFFDHVVIGAGVVGLATAARLSKSVREGYGLLIFMDAPQSALS